MLQLRYEFVTKLCEGSFLMIKEKMNALSTLFKKRRRLKKPVKVILILFLLNVFLFSLALMEHQKKNTFEAHARSAKKENALLKKDLAEKDELMLQPQRAYSLKVRELLKKEKLTHWLLLQTDERWANVSYGWGDEAPTVAMNGCTLDALAIIDSRIKNKEISPETILNWSKNNYFTDQGTSWSIYKDFAEKNKYTYKDLGTDIQNARPYLEKDIPVLAAAKPGMFTTIGHTLVLTHVSDRGFRLLDPSDNSLKNHSLTTYSEEQLSPELVHYWVIYD